MARYKSDLNELKSLEDADRVLKELCALETVVERIDSEGDAEIAEIKARMAKAGKEARERVKVLTSQLKAYSDYNKGELFKDRKSLDRAFGVFGYRKNPPSISVGKSTVELMKKHDLSQFIRVREEADKEAMLSLDDDTLARVDAVRKSKEEFFVQPKREQVNKDLLASA